MNKTIFIYWHSGFDRAPNLVRKCLRSWKIHNPTWKIVELDDQSWPKLVAINHQIPFLRKKKITKTSFSDLLRIFLLNKYGGCWCDATVLCNKPLDDWLPKYIETGYFSFEMTNNCKISSWFLYAEKDNYIIQEWKKATIEYINKSKNIGNDSSLISLKIWQSNKYHYPHYFWFHYLFGDLYESDPKFKDLWDSTKKIRGANLIALFVIQNGKEPDVDLIPRSPNILMHKPMYKLTQRYDFLNLKKIKKPSQHVRESTAILTNIKFLNPTFKLKFLHVPKTGGTSIENAAKENGIFWGRFDKSLVDGLSNGSSNKSSNKKTNISAWHVPQQTEGVSFCVIRCPFDRLISQFYHDNRICDYVPQKLNQYIRKHLILFQQRNHLGLSDNHFLFQSAFYQYCNIAISFKNLQQNLNKLTSIYSLPDLPLEILPGGLKQQQKRKNAKFIRLTKDNINLNNLQLIKRIYHQDFDLWDEIEEKNIIINKKSFNKV